MSAVLSPEERAERVRMALAEDGYADAAVWHDEDDDEIHAWVFEVGKSSWWRALALCGEALRCWPCFDAAPTIADRIEDGYQPCDHDPLTSPWPEVVR